MSEARRSSRSDDRDEEETAGVTPDLATIHAVAHGEPVPDTTPPVPVVTPDVPPAPVLVDRDVDIGAALQTMSAELCRIKAAYGEDTARIIGERALLTMRRS